jgi:uncharacterized protein (UPF0335 family)
MTESEKQLRSIVDRIENIEGEIKDRNDDKKEIYAEAKGNGFDVKALKAVIARRRNRPATEELDALVETYECALGTGIATHVQAQEAA